MEKKHNGFASVNCIQLYKYICKLWCTQKLAIELALGLQSSEWPHLLHFISFSFS